MAGVLLAEGMVTDSDVGTCLVCSTDGKEAPQTVAEW